MTMRRVRITAGEVSAVGQLEDTATADAIWEALPIQARANTWGDEIYFSIPVHMGEDDSREVVELGDLGYWPPGNAFCIFFGRTPASTGDEIRPASPVNVFGRLEGDPKTFKAVRGGTGVTVEALEN